MIALLLAVALCPHPHRSRAAVQMFVKAHPCPKTCALYKKGEKKPYYKCGACAVDHICPLAACGIDAPRNMQWLDAKENRKKSDDASLCTKELLDPQHAWKRDWEMPP